MTGTLILASAFAGFVYGIAPGPAVLALFGISANQGRGAGISFVSGHLLGDALWTSLALVAIIGAQSVGSVVFDLLGLLCAGYLFWLGWGAVTAKPREGGEMVLEVRRPVVRGLLFGLTNPKGYPVAVATFAALLTSHAADLSWAGFPALVLAACLGSFTAYLILVAVTGTGTVRRFYRRYEIWIVRASGLMFIGFALHAVLHSASGLMARRA